MYSNAPLHYVYAHYLAISIISCMVRCVIGVNIATMRYVLVLVEPQLVRIGYFYLWLGRKAPVGSRFRVQLFCLVCEAACFF